VKVPAVGGAAQGRPRSACCATDFCPICPEMPPMGGKNCQEIAFFYFFLAFLLFFYYIYLQTYKYFQV